MQVSPRNGATIFVAPFVVSHIPTASEISYTPCRRVPMAGIAPA